MRKLLFVATLIASTAMAQNGPDLKVAFVTAPHRLAPNEGWTIDLILDNTGTSSSHDVQLEVTPTGGGTITAFRVGFIGEQIDCAISEGKLGCAAAEMPPNTEATMEITLFAPPSVDGHAAGIFASARAAESDIRPSNNTASVSIPVVRGFAVTTTADSGAGSLRQAILDAALPCRNAPCAVFFNIPPPVPDSGWFTIRLQTPLPPMPAFMDIDGASQSAFTGDTNRDRPEIEIRGDLLQDGDGLLFQGLCEAYVSNLVISGFPRHAIALSGENNIFQCRDEGGEFIPVVIEKNILGLDPSGKIGAPNLRGIWIDSVPLATIENNLIAGNVRSGIFITHHSSEFEVDDNRLIGNGASGIYVGDTGLAGDIIDNEIADNGEFGVAYAFNTTEVGIHRNRIYGNGLTAIDAGLDLETPNVANDSVTVSNHPVLFSASYDAVSGKTTVRGRLDSEPVPTYSTSFLIEFFASSSLNARGLPQAERYIGNLQQRGDFVFTVEGDFRGQWIAATASRSHIIGFKESLNHRFSVPDATSELSNAVQVTP